MENRFNLIDEPWIPLADKGKVSLKQIFSDISLQSLGGTPIQKIVIIKLLLAISQAAYTPTDDDAWVELGAEGMANKALDYLNKWHHAFWLYGDSPFLQMPKVTIAKQQSFGAVSPEVATGNTTVLTQSQVERSMDDAERAMLIVVLMSFSLGGKKTDNHVVLTSGYKGKENDKGKPSTGKPGSAIGFLGFLHSFLQAESLIESIWLNLLTVEQIKHLGVYPMGIGTAPWEKMPTGEEDDLAQSLQQSYMGRLIPMGRFCLLGDAGMHYSEGVLHSGYLQGMYDPSMAVNFSQKKPKALWVDPQKRPWRQLTALLAFLGDGSTSSFDCHQIIFGLNRARRQVSSIGIWSGGLRVSNNAGEQYVSGADDYVESTTFLQSDWLGETWYAQLKVEMEVLEKISKTLYGATLGYFKKQKSDGTKQAEQCSSLFWQICEREFQSLVDDCGIPERTYIKRGTFVGYAYKSYDAFCPNDTARQLDSWADNRPNFSKYLIQTRKEEV